MNRRPALRPAVVGLLAALALCAPGLTPAPAVAAERAPTTPAPKALKALTVWPTAQQMRPRHGSQSVPVPVPRRVVEVVEVVEVVGRACTSARRHRRERRRPRRRC
ncbi:hypothetical protein [Streptomyces sp. NPDC046862]|uniref:hypothetical protein n=1 Tax=Streptomyces sp. NPDC046862 TaxID=3154603 RepID=UPI00345689FD